MKTINLSKRLLLLLIWTYLGWIIIASRINILIVAGSNSTKDSGVTNTVFSSKCMIIFLIFLIVTPFATWYWAKKRIENYEEDVETAQHALKLLKQTGSILPFSYTIIFTILISLEVGYFSTLEMFYTYFIRFFLMIVACQLTFGQSFSLLFATKLEKAVAVIPIDINAKISTASIAFKLMMTVILTSIAISFFSVLPYISPKNADKTNLQILFMNSLPLTIIVFCFATVSIMGEIKKLKTSLIILNSYFKKLASGDFQNMHAEHTTRDEFGVLFTNFNTFVNQNVDFYRLLFKTTDGSKVISKDLVTHTHNTTANIENINDSIVLADTAVEVQIESITETKNMAEQILKNMRVFNASIDSNATSVVESASAVEQMVNNIRSVTDILTQNSVLITMLEKETGIAGSTIQKAAAMMTKIAEASESLLEASTVIQNVSSQTNLLAMNAAIEAAHAGEVGKGFAVVADEIRKLAEESGSQGKTISATLKAIKDEIDIATKSTLETKVQFKTMAEVTAKVGRQEKIVIDAMQQQNSDSTQVLKSIRDITDATQQIKSSSADILTSSDEIQNEMSKLANASKELKTQLSDLTVSTEEVANSIILIEEISKKNDDAMKEVSKTLNHLKI